MADDEETRDKLFRLSKADVYDLYGEIRRRDRPSTEIRQYLNVPYGVGSEPKPVRSIRHAALAWLAVLTLILVLVVAILALTHQAIPDVFTGLIGTGIGAIAGILVGEKLDGKPKKMDD